MNVIHLHLSLHLDRGVVSHNECPGYEIKQAELFKIELF